MEHKRISALNAIRLKCLDCCGSTSEVKLCPVESCPLYPFRLGKNPYRTKREPTGKQLAALKSPLAQIRPSIDGEKSANPIS